MSSHSIDHQTEQRSLLADAALGLAAGAFAVWILDRVDWLAYRAEPEHTRRQTEAVRPGGMDPAHVAVDRIARATTGQSLANPKENLPGKAMHYAIGIAPSVAYALLRKRVPGLDAGFGTLYGLGVALLEDEIMNPVTGLAAKPWAYPWTAHARSLVAHLVLGVVLEGSLRVLERGLQR